MDVITNKVPDKPFECLAWDFRCKSKHHEQIVDELIAKRLTAFQIGKLIWYGHITEPKEEEGRR